MTDNPDSGPASAGQGAEKKHRKQRKQRVSAAADELAQLSHQAEVVRAELAGLQQNLADVQQSSTGERGTELREANEQLVLAALQAETIAENAVTHLDELAHSSQHDALTGTANRALMLDRLENAIAFARRHGTRIAVLFLDLDEFKHINDTLGHAVGDAVVQLVARRLESVVRHSDTVSRHGGDEFLVLLAEITQPSDAALVAEKILSELAAASRIDNHLVSLSVSIGIALFPEDGTDATTLITAADKAMYSCKKQGGRSFQFYDEETFRSRSLPPPPPDIHDESSTDGHHSAMRALRETNEQLVLSAMIARELQEQSRQKHARQVKFMTMVAHELSNLLVPIKSATGHLFERQVAHMSRLVEDLLDSARDGTEKFQVTMTSIDILDVLSRSVEASRLTIEPRHQRLTISLPAGPLNIEADAVRLAQIFCKLLDNASKNTPDGGEISVTCEPSNDAVVITVSDSGIGIAPARLATLFDLFALDERGSEVRGDLSFGLAVVRELVEAHGGTVVARSPGENLGSEFSVTLPIRHESVEASGGILEFGS